MQVHPLLALFLSLALVAAAPLHAANSPPTITTPAYATPATATGTTSVLRVAASDAAGASSLVFNWSLLGTPPAAVTFSANGTNAARTTTARFTAPGTYNFLVTVTDPAQLTATSSVSVSVVDTPTSMALTPVTVRLNPGATHAFSAIIKDQFGVVLSPQPAITWTAAGGTVSSSGVYTAGSTPGGPFTLTATAGALSKSATITINAPPTVATPAAASANPVVGTTVGLSALGADDLSASLLHYGWSTVGSVPATVSFAPNGTNAAQNTTATFKKAGSYTLQCTITDGGGLTVTTSVAVVVNATPTTVAITPTNPRVNPNASKTFSASVKDQFNVALSPQPSLTWSVSGGGSISSSGVFTAGATPGGPYTVTASTGSGGISGATAVTVNAPPTVATPAAASPSPVIGTTTTLSALGADDAGEPLLRYTWQTKGTVPAAVHFTPNTTNAAKQSTATFAKAGTYTLQCTITDGGGLTATTSVTVSVQATATTLAVTPLSTTVTTGGTQSFTGSLRDQFGLAIVPQPTLTWTAGGGGSISSGGVYTAGTVPGGPYAITAAGGGFTGSASITVTNAPPTIATPAAASPNPVTGTTTALSILGQSVHGAASLSYAWSASGTPPAAVTVAPNGSNAAQSATATFTAAGTYVLQCLVTDGFGGSATSSVAVTVVPTLTTITVAPSTTTVALDGTASFTATAADQFGTALATQPTLGWTVTGPGAIDGFGTFTAAGSAGGPYTVTAADGAVSGTAQVTVVSLPPTIVAAAAVATSPVTGTSVGVSVQASDDAGPAALTFSWSATGTPPGPVTFAPNDTTSAGNSTASFSAAGTYTLQCTITDTANLTTTSSVTVVVAATPTTVTVSPATATSQLNGTSVSYSATVLDQFGTLIATPPAITWSLPSAAGSIDSAGNLIAADVPGGPYTVTGTCQAATGTAQVTVVDLPPTIAQAATASIGASDLTATLTVLGADDGGEGALVYFWSPVGVNPGAVTIAPNGSHAAQVATAQFSAVGTYTLQATVTDASNQTATSSVTMVVPQQLTTIAVTPATASVVASGSIAFAATALDQFAAPLAPQPAITWSVSGGGTITAAGAFTAQTTAGGPFTVVAASGAIQGSAMVSVTAPTGPAVVASNLNLSVIAGTPTPVTLVATDGTQNVLTYAIVHGPSHGTLSGTPPALTYMPAAGYLGLDSFTFTASNATATSPVATVAIYVHAPAPPQNAPATVLITPAPFDAQRWSSDPTYRITYLTIIEPSRIWSMAADTAGAPGLKAVGNRHITAAAGNRTVIAAQGVPGAPVTFAINGEGTFAESNRNTATVVANSSGTATVTYLVPQGGRIPIVAASPLAVGQVRWLVEILPASGIVNPAVPNE